jgi:hypothetical protein
VRFASDSTEPFTVFRRQNERDYPSDVWGPVTTDEHFDWRFPGVNRLRDFGLNRGGRSTVDSSVDGDLLSSCLTTLNSPRVTGRRRTQVDKDCKVLIFSFF